MCDNNFDLIVHAVVIIANQNQRGVLIYNKQLKDVLESCSYKIIGSGPWSVLKDDREVVSALWPRIHEFFFNHVFGANNTRVCKVLLTSENAPYWAEEAVAEFQAPNSCPIRMGACIIGSNTVLVKVPLYETRCDCYTFTSRIMTINNELKIVRRPVGDINALGIMMMIFNKATSPLGMTPMNNDVYATRILKHIATVCPFEYKGGHFVLPKSVFASPILSLWPFIKEIGPMGLSYDHVNLTWFSNSDSEHALYEPFSPSFSRDLVIQTNMTLPGPMISGIVSSTTQIFLVRIPVFNPHHQR